MRVRKVAAPINARRPLSTAGALIPKTMFRLIRSVSRSICTAIKNDPEIIKIAGHYPRFFGFIKKRLTPDETFGLHLTIGTLITALFVFFFFGFLKQFASQSSIIESDISIVNFIQLLRSNGMDAFMLTLTTLGRWSVILVGILVTAMVCMRGKRWHYLVSLITSVGVAALFTGILREVIGNVLPPFENTLVHNGSSIFPGGHTFVAFTFYGLVTYFLFRSFESWIIRTLVFFTGISLIGLIGFSRIYLGIHWPSDIAASFASAAAWLTIMITILEIRQTVRMSYEDEDDRALSNVHILGGFATLCWVVWGAYAVYAFPLALNQALVEPGQHIRTADIPAKLFDSLPRYSETLLGKKTEPINIILIGRETAIDDAFIRAGWTHSDPVTIPSLWRALIASIRDVQDLHAPVTPQFWNTHPNTLAYLKATEKNSVRERHHVRIWKTSMTTENGDVILFGTASFDKGVKLKSSLLIPTHTIDPAIDKERDFVKNDLAKTNAIDRVVPFRITDPILGKNIVGDTFFTDGNSYVIFVRNLLPANTPLSAATK